MDATPLSRWADFYVIVGSAAAALTGLQFVVMAIAADAPSRGATSESIDAFGTPNVVHFSVVLLISAVLSAPWPSVRPVAICLGICGTACLAYGLIVIRRARRQTGYTPVLEDWIWHGGLPLVAYTGVTAASLALLKFEDDALFAVAAVSLLLLFVGIHNAWDTVTYLAAKSVRLEEAAAPPDRHDGP